MQSYNEDVARQFLVEKEAGGGILALGGSGEEVSGTGGVSILKQNIKGNPKKKGKKLSV